jgi:hypothetical protein
VKLQAISAKMSTKMDIKLIPEFGGNDELSVSEWLEKVEIVCKLIGVTDLASVVPLRLTYGAFAVYQQLAETDKEDFYRIKEALLKAFAVDAFTAYEQFVARKLKHGEAVDVYLAELRRLSTLIGGLPDKAIACAFVSGLPGEVRRMLRSSTRMDDLTTIQILARARALMIEERNDGTNDKCAAAATLRSTDPRLRDDQTQPVCYECKLPNHFARDCHLRRKSNQNTSCRRREKVQVRCYSCQEYGHISTMCPKNDRRENTFAPALSLNNQ